LVSIEQFRESFLEKLKSPLFADSDSDTSRPSGTSVATKELRKRRGYDVFTEKFLASIYEILLEYCQLRDEQRRVRGIAKKINPKLAVLRNEMKAVQAMAKKVESLERNPQARSLAEARNRLRAALQNYESDIRRQQDCFNAMVNPAVRKTTLGRVQFENVLKLDKYSLATLRKKAPEYWVCERLNQVLARTMQPLGISDMTRYRVISALLEYVGLNIKPITFKQHRPKKDRE